MYGLHNPQLFNAYEVHFLWGKAHVFNCTTLAKQRIHFKVQLVSIKFLLSGPFS